MMIDASHNIKAPHMEDLIQSLSKLFVKAYAPTLFPVDSGKNNSTPLIDQSPIRTAQMETNVVAACSRDTFRNALSSMIRNPLN